MELYNLDEDLAETENVARAHPEVAARLYTLLEASHSPAPPQNEPSAPKGRYYR